MTIGETKIWGTGRTLAIVPRSQVARGFMDPDMDDEEAGSFWDRLQDRVLGASIRTVVSRSAWVMATLLTCLLDPC